MPEMPIVDLSEDGDEPDLLTVEQRRRVLLAEMAGDILRSKMVLGKAAVKPGHIIRLADWLERGDEPGEPDLIDQVVAALNERAPVPFHTHTRECVEEAMSDPEGPTGGVRVDSVADLLGMLGELRDKIAGRATPLQDARVGGLREFLDFLGVPPDAEVKWGEPETPTREKIEQIIVKAADLRPGDVSTSWEVIERLPDEDDGDGVRAAARITWIPDGGRTVRTWEPDEDIVLLERGPEPEPEHLPDPDRETTGS